MVADEATKQFSPRYIESENKDKRIAECCKDLDRMIEMFDGRSFEVSIDNATHDVLLSLTCSIEDFQTDVKSSPFYNVMYNANRVVLERAGENLVRMDLTYPGIWVRGEIYE